MVQPSIQNLIKAHEADKRRLEHAGSLPQIPVSKAVSAMAKLYEVLRNTIEYEEEHLLRKRAIKRIILRMGALKREPTQDMASDIVKEILWAKYLSDFPAPEAAIGTVMQSLQKYKHLVDTFIKIYGDKPGKDTAGFLYSMLAVEIERILIPSSGMDALVNAEYQFLLPMKLLMGSGVPDKYVPVQTYIAIQRALLKSDRDIIGYYLFHNAFNQWATPNEEYYVFIAKNIEKAVRDINEHLAFHLKPKLIQEIVRQSVPFRIINNIIRRNIADADKTFSNRKELDTQIENVCKAEYRRIKGRQRTTIIRSIMYLFVTKVFLALILEVPYELLVFGSINYVTLGINIIFPPILMFLIASTFSIPEVKNTQKLKEMIATVMNPTSVDLSQINRASLERGGVMNTAFRALNLFSFFLVFGLIIMGLIALHFNIMGILIFIMFLTLITFVAVRLRKTAKEIVVVNEARSIFSPFIDIASVPILRIGRTLSDSVSQLNIFTIIFDVLLEAPFKTIIKIIEDWTSYLREQRDQIV